MATKKKSVSAKRKAPTGKAGLKAQPLSKADASKKSSKGTLVFVTIGMLAVLVGLVVQAQIMARHQASLKFSAIHVGKIIPQGLDDGQARSPLALQGDKSDNLFFLEGQSDQAPRLQKFDPSGNFIEKYVPKKVNELIANPVDMDVDQDGQPWVLLHTGQIQVLSADLKYLRTVSVAVNGPSAIGLASDGRIFVASQSDNKVLYFDGNGKKLGEFGAPGTNTGDITSPVRMRVTVDGLIAVMENTPTGPHVKVFGPDLKLKTQFDLKDLSFNEPLKMGVTVDDKMTVNDQPTNRGLLVWDLKTGDFYGESKGCTDNDLFLEPGSSGANKYTKSIYVHSVAGLTHCLLPEAKSK